MITEFGYIETDYVVKQNQTKDLSLKVFSYVFIDSEYGALVFDTGAPTAKDIFFHTLQETFAIRSIEDIWIFNTHLHLDHIGSNHHLKDAKMVLSRSELANVRVMVEVVEREGNLHQFVLETCPDYKGRFSVEDAQILKTALKRHWPGEKAICNYRISYIEDNPKIPDCVSIVPTFGHTRHHYSYKIHTEAVDFLITGDALSNRLELLYLEEEGEHEPQEDLTQYLETKRAIGEFVGIIAPAHDRPFYTKNFKTIKSNPVRLADVRAFQKMYLSE